MESLGGRYLYLVGVLVTIFNSPVLSLKKEAYDLVNVIGQKLHIYMTYDE